MLFTGEYSYHLDSKNRLVVPRKIRDRVLHEVREQGLGWYLVPGFDGTISLYTPATFERLASDQQAEMFRLRDIRNYDRLHFGLSSHAEMDGTGRIRIPDVMLRRAGIGKDVAIVGVGDHLEIWDQGRWDAYVGQNFAAYDDMAERAFRTRREQGGEAATPAGKDESAGD